MQQEIRYKKIAKVDFIRVKHALFAVTAVRQLKTKINPDAI